MHKNHYSNLSNYELTHLAAHLVGSGQDNYLVKLLTDAEYLEHKTEAGMILGLVNDFSVALSNLPNSNFWYEFIQIVLEALSRDLSFISQHPSTLFQCLWNTCWWYDSPVLEDHYTVENTYKSNHLIPWKNEKPKLYKWMEKWRSVKEQDSNFVWIRQCRPPVEPLGTNLTKELRGHNYVVWRAYFSPCRKFIASSSANIPGEEKQAAQIILWDAVNGTIKKSVEQEAMDIAFSPDAQYLATASVDGSIYLWGLKYFNLEKEFNLSGYKPKTIEFSSDGKQIIIGCFSGAVLVFTLQSEKVAEVYAHKDTVVFVNYLNEDSKIISSSRGGSVYVWDTKTNELINLLNLNGQIGNAAVSPNERLIAIAQEPKKFYSNTTEESHIKLFDLGTSKLIGELTGHTTPVNSVAFSPEGKYLLSGSGSFLSSQDNTIRLWDVKKLTELKAFAGHSSGVTSANFSSDGKKIVSASFDRTIRIWDRDKIDTSLKLKNHIGDVFGISFSPNGKFIVTSAWDDTDILLWDAEKGTIIHTMKGHESLIRCFRFSDDSRFLVSGSGSKYNGVDCTVRLWDVNSGTQLAVFESRPSVGELHGHVNPVKFVGFSSNGSRIISGHADLMSFAQWVNTIRIWDRYSGKLLDCFAGDESRAHILTEYKLTEYLRDALERGTKGQETDLQDHPLVRGDINNVRSIAAYMTSNLLGLKSSAQEIRIQSYEGEVGFLPEQLGLSFAACPTKPIWAIGKGNNLIIFALENMNMRILGESFLPESAPLANLQAQLQELIGVIVDADWSGVKRALSVNPDLAKASDADGLTALHHLAKHFYITGSQVRQAEEIAIELLNYGADPNARDLTGSTPLHYIVTRSWDIEVAEILLRHGADQTMLDHKGNTPYNIALHIFKFIPDPLMLNLLNRYK